MWIAHLSDKLEQQWNVSLSTVEWWCTEKLNRKQLLCFTHGLPRHFQDVTKMLTTCYTILNSPIHRVCGQSLVPIWNTTPVSVKQTIEMLLCSMKDLPIQWSFKYSNASLSSRHCPVDISTEKHKFWLNMTIFKKMFFW